MHRFLREFSSTIAAELTLPFTIKIARNLNKIHLNPNELFYISSIIKKRIPIRFLVFGLGNDSPFWYKLNRHGETIFIEDIPEWFSINMHHHPKYVSFLVKYDTQISQWKELIDFPEKLRMTFPPEIEKEKFDCILVDGPHGWKDSEPGRMKSIFAASRLVKDNGDVFVHDCDRLVEVQYCDRFLGSGVLVRNSSRLRHYHFPSESLVTV